MRVDAENTAFDSARDAKGAAEIIFKKEIEASPDRDRALAEAA